MPLAHLLAVVMVVSLCVRPLLAQSQRNDNSGEVPSQAIAPNLSSSNPATDLFRLDPSLRVWFGSQSSAEADTVPGNHADDYAQSQSQDLPRIRERGNRFTTEMQPPFDATCYAIRSYIVVRDSPHSDTTHRDGSTTCVPAARIRMYSTVDQGR
jgi:hypothetical protein